MEKNKKRSLSFKDVQINLNDSMHDTINKYYHARMELVELVTISTKNRRVYDNSINNLVSKKKLDERQRAQLAKDLQAKALELAKVQAFKKKQNDIFMECFSVIPESLLKAFGNKSNDLSTFRKELEKFFSDNGITMTDSMFQLVNQFGITSSGNSLRISNQHIKVESNKKFSTFLFDVILQCALDNELIQKINIDYVKELKAEEVHSLDCFLKSINEVKKPKNLTEYKKVFKELGIATPKETNKQGYAKAFAKYVRTINSVLVD